MDKEEQLKVLALKHASSTSSITQSADIGRQFAILKQTSKKATSVNLPSGFGLKGTLEDELIRLQANNTLLLKTPMRKAIIDHSTSCPKIFGNVMQPKITKKGFFENGMINTNIETYPDIIKMMRTCKLKDFRQEHEDINFNNFSEFYNKMKNSRHVSEETYSKIGLPKDTKYAGEEVRTYILYSFGRGPPRHIVFIWARGPPTYFIHLGGEAFYIRLFFVGRHIFLLGGILYSFGRQCILYSTIFLLVGIYFCWAAYCIHLGDGAFCIRVFFVGRHIFSLSSIVYSFGRRGILYSTIFLLGGIYVCWAA